MEIDEFIQDIRDNRDRDFNFRCLIKRLHRIDKQMSGEARPHFAAHLPDGDVARYARGLEGALKANFVGAMRTSSRSSS